MNWQYLLTTVAPCFAMGAYIGHLRSDRRRIARALEIADGQNDRLNRIVSWARTAIKQSQDGMDAHAAAINFALNQCGDGVNGPEEGAQFLAAWRDGEWGVIAHEWPEFDLTTAGLTPKIIAELKEVGSDG